MRGATGCARSKPRPCPGRAVVKRCHWVSFVVPVMPDSYPGGRLVRLQPGDGCGGPDVDFIARVEADGRLVEACRVIVVRVGAEHEQLAVIATAPLGHDVFGAHAKSAAAIDHDVETVRRFDAHAGGPAPVDTGFLDRETRPVCPERCPFRGAAQNVFDACVDVAAGIGVAPKIGQHLRQ